MVRFTTIIFTSLVMASQSLIAAQSETENFDFELDEGGRISLENINGDIDISAGSGNTVKIVAVKRADNAEDLEKLKVKIKADSNSIRIETVHEKSGDRWFGSSNSGEVSYTLTVPVSTDLDSITTVNGDVDIEGVTGTVRAESINGELRLDNLAGDVNLETTNGAIEATFDRLAGSQRVSADTVNGRITLNLPSDTSARVSAETLNGGIDADDFGLEPDESGFIGKDLSGNIGSGEARVDLDTVNGGIQINKRS